MRSPTFQGARSNPFYFRDIYLHDVRFYRERQLAPLGIEVVEPLWGVVSSEIVMQQYLASGLKTVIVTTQADGLGMDAIGREVDADFIASLPKEMDPNGENGEYHTFCYDGPIFSSPVLFRLGTPFSQSYDIRLRMARFKPILIVLPIFPPNHTRITFAIINQQYGKQRIYTCLYWQRKGKDNGRIWACHSSFVCRRKRLHRTIRKEHEI